MDRVDVTRDTHDGAADTVRRESAPEDGRPAIPGSEAVNFTYNGFFGFAISDWVQSLLSKKTPAGR